MEKRAKAGRANFQDQGPTGKGNINKTSKEDKYAVTWICLLTILQTDNGLAGHVNALHFIPSLNAYVLSKLRSFIPQSILK